MSSPVSCASRSLNGYAVFSSATESEYKSFESALVDDDRGEDDWKWLNECEEAGTATIAMIVPMMVAKAAGAFTIYRRVNTNTDAVFLKFLGCGLEFGAGWLIVSVVTNWALSCYAELPTGDIFIPDDGVDDATLALIADKDDDEATDDALGTNYNILVITPYTCFFFLLISGLSSFYISWVHIRTPTWGAELQEEW